MCRRTSNPATFDHVRALRSVGSSDKLAVCEHRPREQTMGSPQADGTVSANLTPSPQSTSATKGTCAAIITSAESRHRSYKKARVPQRALVHGQSVDPRPPGSPRSKTRQGNGRECRAGQREPPA
jgi:hypothetical protein